LLSKFIISIIIFTTIIIIINIEGSAWTQTSAPNGDWLSIASDSSGKYLAAVQLAGYIYTSSSG